MLRTIAPYTNEMLRLLYYKSFMFPHFIYCSTVWSLKNKQSMETIFKLQKQAVRLITGSDSLAPSLQLFVRLKIVPIVFQYKINKLIMVFKSINHKAPVYLTSKFTSVSSGRATRSVDGELLALPPYQRNSEKSFEISGARLWNSLPVEIRRLGSVSFFKDALKQRVLSKMKNIVEITDLWCHNCTVEHQLEVFFCEHMSL